MKRCPTLLIRSLTLGIVTALTGIGTAHAADWYLVQSNQSEQNWNFTGTNNSAAYKYWANSPTVTTWVDNGSGSDPRYAVAMDPTATYYVLSGKAVRTGTSGANLTFGGGKLILVGAELGMRSGANTAYVGNLEAQGATFSSYVSGTTNLHIGTLAVTGSSTSTFQVGATANNRTENVTIDTLSGGADLTFSNGTGGSTGTAFNVSIGEASAFTGNLVLSSGTLTFTSSLTAGSLILNGGTFNLTNNITVSSLTIAGSALLDGNYTSTQLATYGITATGAGLITVSAIPEPAHAAILFSIAALAFVASRRRIRV